MAVNNNKVQITAGLVNTQLTDPPIGSAGSAATTGYTDGDKASDSYIALATTPGVALNTDLGGNGYIKVTNPNTQGVTLTTTVGGVTTVIGTIPGVANAGDTPFAAVFPIDSGVVIKGYVASGTPTVGVTVIKVTPNA